MRRPRFVPFGPHAWSCLQPVGVEGAGVCQVGGSVQVCKYGLLVRGSRGGLWGKCRVYVCVRM